MWATKNIGLLFFIATVLLACTKEPVTHQTIVAGNTSDVYNVNDVNVTQKGIDKINQKTITEYASIAYSDIYQKNISQTELDKIGAAFAAFGDKTLIEDLVIRNFLNNNGIALPTKTAMNTDIEIFVTDTYKKLLSREPNEFEKWYLTDLIQKDTAITPEIVYYSFLTSNEYRFY